MWGTGDNSPLNSYFLWLVAGWGSSLRATESRTPLMNWTDSGVEKRRGDSRASFDDARARGFGEAEEFGDAGAQDVAIDGGHALQAPVLGVALEEGADLVVALHGDAED